MVARNLDQVRIFVDENDLGLAKGLANLRHDVVHPGHRLLPDIPTGTLDDDWMPYVGKAGWVVISRDERIRRRPAERALLRSHGLRCFFLTGKTGQSTWKSARLLLSKWDALERLAGDRPEGPWAYSVTDNMREIDLG